MKSITSITTRSIATLLCAISQIEFAKSTFASDFWSTLPVISDCAILQAINEYFDDDWSLSECRWPRTQLEFFMDASTRTPFMTGCLIETPRILDSLPFAYGTTCARSYSNELQLKAMTCARLVPASYISEAKAAFSSRQRDYSRASSLAGSCAQYSGKLTFPPPALVGSLLGELSSDGIAVLNLPADAENVTSKLTVGHLGPHSGPWKPATYAELWEFSRGDYRRLSEIMTRSDISSTNDETERIGLGSGIEAFIEYGATDIHSILGSNENELPALKALFFSLYIKGSLQPSGENLGALESLSDFDARAFQRKAITNILDVLGAEKTSLDALLSASGWHSSQIQSLKNLIPTNYTMTTMSITPMECVIIMMDGTIESMSYSSETDSMVFSPLLVGCHWLPDLPDRIKNSLVETIKTEFGSHLKE